MAESSKSQRRQPARTAWKAIKRSADQERQCKGGTTGRGGERECEGGGRNRAIRQLFPAEIVQAATCIFDCSGNHLHQSVQGIAAPRIRARA
jgi:hypothetical protein